MRFILFCVIYSAVRVHSEFFLKKYKNIYVNVWW